MEKQAVNQLVDQVLRSLADADLYLSRTIISPILSLTIRPFLDLQAFYRQVVGSQYRGDNSLEQLRAILLDIQTSLGRIQGISRNFFANPCSRVLNSSGLTSRGSEPCSSRGVANFLKVSADVNHRPLRQFINKTSRVCSLAEKRVSEKLLNPFFCFLLDPFFVLKEYSEQARKLNLVERSLNHSKIILVDAKSSLESLSGKIHLFVEGHFPSLMSKIDSLFNFQQVPSDRVFGSTSESLVQEKKPSNPPSFEKVTEREEGISYTGPDLKSRSPTPFAFPQFPSSLSDEIESSSQETVREGDRKCVDESLRIEEGFKTPPPSPPKAQSSSSRKKERELRHKEIETLHAVGKEGESYTVLPHADNKKFYDKCRKRYRQLFPEQGPKYRNQTCQKILECTQEENGDELKKKLEQSGLDKVDLGVLLLRFVYEVKDEERTQMLIDWLKAQGSSNILNHLHLEKVSAGWFSSPPNTRTPGDK